MDERRKRRRTRHTYEMGFSVDIWSTQKGRSDPGLLGVPNRGNV